jgi:hypothetical protein
MDMIPDLSNAESNRGYTATSLVGGLAAFAQFGGGLGGLLGESRALGIGEPGIGEPGIGEPGIGEPGIGELDPAQRFRFGTRQILVAMAWLSALPAALKLAGVLNAPTLFATLIWLLATMLTWRPARWAARRIACWLRRRSQGSTGERESNPVQPFDQPYHARPGP